MSHPNPSHDKENEYPSDHYKPGTSKSKALKKKAGGLNEVFGGTHNPKALKRLLKKSKSYRVKHF